MAYTPTDWQNGDTITADKLNKMESGISVASYVPTEWKNGDTITAQLLNHMEQGIAAGSSGGDVTVESLSVTENGTYTAPSGTAYSPVVVDVPSGGGGDVEPSLPAEYQEVQYMDFDGASFVDIDTRYLQAGDVLETHMMFTDGGTSEQCFLGTHIAVNGTRIEFNFSSGKIGVYCASMYARGAIDAFNSKQVTGGGYLSQVNVSLNEKKYAMMMIDSVQNDRYLRIGAYATGTGALYYGYRSRGYKVKHSQDQIVIGNASGNFGSFTHEVVAWYKPCYRKADNVPGWYDTRTNTFYTNLGAGTMTPGPAVA